MALREASANTLTPGRGRPLGGKKYSSGGTAIGAYESFCGAETIAAPPAHSTRGAVAAAAAAEWSAPSPPPLAKAGAPSESGTPSSLSSVDAVNVTPDPASSSTDAEGAVTPQGWTRACTQGVRSGGQLPKMDVRLLQAKVLALEGKCRSLASQNERLQASAGLQPQPRTRGAAPTVPAPPAAHAAAASAWLSASRAPPPRAARPEQSASRDATTQCAQGESAYCARGAPPQPEEHAVFGRLLHDFGYKKLYLSSARKLIDHVPIWCRQRPVERARVAEIRASKLRHGAAFAGVISVFEMVPPSARQHGAAAGGVRQSALERPQSVGIFDGQHRLCAISGMLAPYDQQLPEHAAHAAGAGGGCAGGAPITGAGAGAAIDGVRATRAASSALAPTPACVQLGAVPRAPAGCDALPLGSEQLLSDVELLTEVFPVHSEEEVKHWFLELNKAEIVKEIDLPDTIAPSKKRTIDEAVDLLRARYPEMFKPSERCRPPHVHRDTLRNKIFNHDIVGDALMDAQALLAVLERVNTQLMGRTEASWPQPVRKALPKARANGFFLGLNDYGWLEALSGSTVAP